MKTKSLILASLLPLSLLASCGSNKTYTATFKNGDTVVGTVTFKKGDTTIEEPAVPTLEHYTGAWENYSLGTQDIVINTVYTPIEYTASFYQEDKTTLISEVKFDVTNYQSKQAPEVPLKTGYEGTYDHTVDFSTLKDDTYYVVYSAVVYTATFYDVDGETVIGTVEYTIENASSKQAPNIPAKAGYIGSWDKEVNFEIYENQSYVLSYELEGLKVKAGDFKLEDNKYVSTKDGSLAVDRSLSFEGGTLSTIIKKGDNAKDDGIVFGVTYKDGEKKSYWEDASVDYYFFFISQNNTAYLGGFVNNNWLYVTDWDINPYYPAGSEVPVSISLDNGYYYCYVGNIQIASIKNELSGKEVGYRAAGTGTSYAPFTVSQDVKDLGLGVTHGRAEEVDGDLVSRFDGMVALQSGVTLEEGKYYSTTVKQGNANDVALVFGADASARRCWEDNNKPYYMHMLNAGGLIFFADIPWNIMAQGYIKDINFNPANFYTLSMSFKGKHVKLYVNNVLYCETDVARDLVGTAIGVRAAKEGTVFSPITVSDLPTAPELLKKAGYVNNYINGIARTNSDGTTVYLTEQEFSAKGGTFSCDIQAENGLGDWFGLNFGGNDYIEWGNGHYSLLIDQVGNIAVMYNLMGQGWALENRLGFFDPNATNPVGDTKHTYSVNLNTETWEIKVSYDGVEVISCVAPEGKRCGGTKVGFWQMGGSYRNYSNFVVTPAK